MLAKPTQGKPTSATVERLRKRYNAARPAAGSPVGCGAVKTVFSRAVDGAYHSLWLQAPQKAATHEENITLDGVSTMEKPAPVCAATPPAEAEPTGSIDPAERTTDTEAGVDASEASGTVEQVADFTPAVSAMPMPGSACSAQDVATSAAPSAERFLAALPAVQRLAVERARGIFISAGGVVDPYTNVFLTRFCIGNNWDAARTEAHLRKTLAWRASTNADAYRAAAIAGKKLLEHEEIQRFLRVITGVHQMGCTTSGGHAVDYLTVGSVSAKRFLNELDEQTYIEGNVLISEYQYVHFDRLTLERGDGKLVKMFSVFDLDGLRMEHISFRMQARFKLTAPLHDLYYPEIMHATVLINAPSFFANFWRLFGRTFSKERREAVQVYTRGRAAEVLTRAIAKEWVPACYGGELRQLPAQTMRDLGFDALPDDELRQLMPGPTKWLGHFVLSEAEVLAMQAGES